MYYLRIRQKLVYVKILFDLKIKRKWSKNKYVNNIKGNKLTNTP